MKQESNILEELEQYKKFVEDSQKTLETKYSDYQKLLSSLIVNSAKLLTSLIHYNGVLSSDFIIQWHDSFNIGIDLLFNNDVSKVIKEEPIEAQYLEAIPFVTDFKKLKLGNLLSSSSVGSNFWQYFWLTLTKAPDFKNAIKFLEELNQLEVKMRSSISNPFWENFFAYISKLKSFENANHLIRCLYKIDITGAFYADRQSWKIFFESISPKDIELAAYLSQYIRSLEAKNPPSLSLFEPLLYRKIFFEASKLIDNSSDFSFGVTNLINKLSSLSTLITMVNKIVQNSFNGDINALPKNRLFWAYCIDLTYRQFNMEKKTCDLYNSKGWPLRSNASYDITLTKQDHVNHYIEEHIKKQINELTQLINKQIELENNHYQQNQPQSFSSSLSSLSSLFKSCPFGNLCVRLFDMADSVKIPTHLFANNKEYKHFIEYAPYVNLLDQKNTSKRAIDQVWQTINHRFSNKFKKAMRKLAFQEAVIDQITAKSLEITPKDMDEKFKELKRTIYDHGFPALNHEEQLLLNLWALFGYIEDNINNNMRPKNLPQSYQNARDFIRYENYVYDSYDEKQSSHKYKNSTSDTWITLDQKQYELLDDKSQYRELRTLDYIISSPLSTEIYKYISSHYDKIIQDLSSYNPKLKSILSDRSTPLLLKLPPPALYNNNSSEFTKNLEL